MGMSVHVVGIKPPDEKWNKMKKIWDSCMDAEVEVPEEVLEYFNYEEPDSNGVVVEISSEKWSGDGQAGLQIRFNDIPEDVDIIRFYNFW